MDVTDNQTDDPRMVAEAYVDAAGRHAYDRVSDLLHPDVEFRGPYVNLRGAPQYIAALRRLEPIRVGHVLERTFVDGDEACVFYDFVTCTTAGAIPMVERITVEDGRVRRIRLAFDREQFAPARAELARGAAGPAA